jgi:CubicO group peptidase (beta-lactamase class C family)
VHGPGDSRITVRDFYAQRSGLPDHAGDLRRSRFSRTEILHRLRFQRPDSSFRSSYAYTNFGITEAAIAAAKAAGKKWEAVSKEKLYEPLGMTSTSSRYADFLAAKNRATGHVNIDGKWVPKYQRDPDAQSPAGGVSSSVNDMAKWMRLQLADGRFEGREIVKKDALDETHHPIILTGFSPLDGLPGFYGLGWNVRYDSEGRLELSHSGAFALGAATSVMLVPSRR